MNGLDYFGAEMPAPPRPHFSWPGSALALVGGLVSSIFVRKHPVLAFINGAALVSNAHAVAKGDRTWKDAAKRVGRHVVATAGSLALPVYPAIGYVAGAIAADLLIDGEGGGLIEEWAQHVGVDQPEVIEAVDVTPKTTALAKVT